MLCALGPCHQWASGMITAACQCPAIGPLTLLARRHFATPEDHYHQTLPAPFLDFDRTRLSPHAQHRDKSVSPSRHTHLNLKAADFTVALAWQSSLLGRRLGAADTVGTID